MDVVVTPGMSLADALACLRAGGEDALRYEDESGQRWVLHRDDADRMVHMGLQTVPVEAVSLPEGSALTRQEAWLPTTVDYSGRLSEFFPVYFVAALYELQSLAQRYGVKAYVVGGIARDLLLRQEKRLEVQDVDVTVEGDALALANFLEANSKNCQLVGHFPEFGTAKLRYRDHLNLDLASTRQEVYSHCGALPVVVARGVSLAHDVVRRDFSINTLAFSVHELGRVLDHVHGIRDIQQRQIRVLHPVSFFEDPSRILRALKFCARFDFELSVETEALLIGFLRHGLSFYKGGGDRIKQELKDLFSVEESEAKSRWLSFFLTHDCYRLLDTEVDWRLSADTRALMVAAPRYVAWLQDQLSAYTQNEFVWDVFLCLLLRDLTPDDLQEVANRLGLTKTEREVVEQYRKVRDGLLPRLRELTERASPVEIYELYRGVHLVTLGACLLEVGIQDEPRMTIALEALMHFKRKWERLTLELDGNDLLELGVPAGKTVGQMLNALLHAKLAGRVPERLDEVAYIRQQLGASSPSSVGDSDMPVSEGDGLDDVDDQPPS